MTHRAPVPRKAAKCQQITSSPAWRVVEETRKTVAESLYVATDEDGVEHGPEGEVHWKLPGGDHALTVGEGQPLVLLPVSLMLDRLDACIWRAEPVATANLSPDGSTTAASARLVQRTSWDVRSATGFALDCAAHSLGRAVDATLPDGTTLQSVLDYARQLTSDNDRSSEARLGYFARLSALRRLKQQRGDLSDMQGELISEDAVHDIAALDDPAYATLLPVAEAVLAAIEALRHQVLPRAYALTAEARQEREAHAENSRAGAVPTLEPTPWGTIEVGGHRVLEFAPAWASARNAARYARHAALLRGGKAAEQAEQEWQIDALAARIG